MHFGEVSISHIKKELQGDYNSPPTPLESVATKNVAEAIFTLKGKEFLERHTSLKTDTIAQRDLLNRPARLFRFDFPLLKALKSLPLKDFFQANIAKLLRYSRQRSSLCAHLWV